MCALQIFILILILILIFIIIKHWKYGVQYNSNIHQTLVTSVTLDPVFNDAPIWWE